MTTASGACSACARHQAPAGQARDDLDIIFDLARRLGHDWGPPDAERVWNELRALSPVHAGMSYARLEALGGMQWPCYDEQHPGEAFLHSRLWERPGRRPARAASRRSSIAPPVDKLDDEFPLRLTTGRRLDEYNTGVQTGGYASPLRRGETLDISPEDAARLGFAKASGARALAPRRGRGARCTSTRRCAPG